MLNPAQGEIEIEAGRRVFAPGDELAGTVHWRLGEAPVGVSLRLFWQTQGRGDSDVDVVEEESFEAPGTDDRRPFRFRLPEGHQPPNALSRRPRRTPSRNRVRTALR